MTTAPRWALALCLTVLASGCATVRTTTLETPEPPPKSRDLPPAPAPPREARPPSAATVALLAETDRLEREGNLDRAAATLERALRIEPDDPALWHRLATVRLRQGQSAQAEQMAKKSNTLAGGDTALQARNWQIIARARRAAGDEAGAQIAEARAREFGAGRR